MFRFKLSAILLSLVARLGLTEPNYSVLDENSNRWLPDDTVLTGLNTIYNSLSQGLTDNDDKKKRPLSVIAAAIVEYLSSDLTDEQAKLNSALNTLTRKVTVLLQDEFNALRNKLTRKEATRTPDAVRIEPDSGLIGNDEDHDKEYTLKPLDKVDIETANKKHEQYDYTSFTDEKINKRDPKTTSPYYP